MSKLEKDEVLYSLSIYLENKLGELCQGEIPKPLQEVLALKEESRTSRRSSNKKREKLKLEHSRKMSFKPTEEIDLKEQIDQKINIIMSDYETRVSNVSFLFDSTIKQLEALKFATLNDLKEQRTKAVKELTELKIAAKLHNYQGATEQKQEIEYLKSQIKLLQQLSSVTPAQSSELEPTEAT